MYHMVYPEDRQVSEKQLLSWAEDSWVNKDIERRPVDVEDAIFLLEDAGFITISSK